MKIIPFPTGADVPDAAVIAELEAALAGAAGPGANAWRQLSEDVRVLAAPIDPGFERTLGERLNSPAPAEDDPQPGASAPGRLQRWWAAHTTRSRVLTGGGVGVLAALLLAIVIVGPFKSAGKGLHIGRGPALSQSSPAAAKTAAPTSSRAAKADELGPSTESSAAASAPAVSAVPSTPASPSPARVEQLAASLTLGTTASEVQRVSDQIGRAVTAEGGYVASSQVQVESRGESGATLSLSVPSAHLARTLSALGRLGAVRAETQSQQDITDAYGASKRALADAVAERAALLRALAAASTQGEIESLHRRLALSGAAIDRARNAFGRISREASNSNVEVTVVGDSHTTGGLTLGRGLHDAGRVLTVALGVLLIGLAALIPIALVALAFGLGARVLRRGRRERALRGS